MYNRRERVVLWFWRLGDWMSWPICKGVHILEGGVLDSVYFFGLRLDCLNVLFVSRTFLTPSRILKQSTVICSFYQLRFPHAFRSCLTELGQ